MLGEVGKDLVHLLGKKTLSEEEIGVLLGHVEKLSELFSAVVEVGIDVWEIALLAISNVVLWQIAGLLSIF